jgi:hypothetical protein
MAPSIPGIVEALEAAYDGAHDLADAAREHALQYDADLIAELYLAPACRDASRSETYSVSA